MKPRILIADDHAFNRRMLAQRFEGRGLQVETADNGREALARWRRGDYDLLVLDCAMPDLDGHAVAREIRRLEAENRRTPIIGVCAYHSTETSQHALDAGMDAQLPKWGSDTELDHALGKVLGGSAPSDNAHYTGLRRLRELETAAASPGLTQVVTRRFLQQTPALLRRLEALKTEGDLPVLAELAHTLRGMAGMVGAAQLCREALELERAALCDDMAAVTRQLPRLDDAWRAVARILKHELAPEATPSSARA